MVFPGSWPADEFEHRAPRNLTITLTLSRDGFPWCRDVFDVLADGIRNKNISTNDPMTVFRIILHSLQDIPRQQTYEAIFLRTLKRFQSQLGGSSGESQWKEMITIVDGFTTE